MNCKMAKLERLNSFLTERLMAALNEIMDVVGGTVQEYEDEMARVRRENEYLKGRLNELERNTDETSRGPAISVIVEEQSFDCVEKAPEPTETQQNHDQGETEHHVRIKSEMITFQADPVKPDPENDSATLPTYSTSSPHYVERDRENLNRPDKNSATEDVDFFSDSLNGTKMELTETSYSTDMTNYNSSQQRIDLDTECAQSSHHSQQIAHTEPYIGLTKHFRTSSFCPRASRLTILSQSGPVYDGRFRCTNRFRYHRDCCEMGRGRISRSSPVWKYFSLKHGDCSRAVCNLCGAELSRGRKEYTTSALLKHLRMKHGKC